MATGTGSLTIDIRAGESITIDGGITVEVLEKSGRTARLRVSAPRDVPITKNGGDEEAVHRTVHATK